MRPINFFITSNLLTLTNCNILLSNYVALKESLWDYSNNKPMLKIIIALFMSCINH